MQPSAALSTKTLRPFLTLGRMDGREDQVVLVEMGRPGHGRWSQQAGQASARSGSVRATGNREAICSSCRRSARRTPRVIVHGARDAARTEACAYKRRRATAPLLAYRLENSSTKAGQSAGGSRQRAERGKARVPRRRRPPSCRAPGGRRWADAGEELQDAEAGHPVARILDEPQHGEHVLDVRRIQKLQAAELNERDAAARQFELKRALMVRGAEQHGLLFQRHARLAVLEDLFEDIARPGSVSSRTVTRSGFSSEYAVGPEVLRETFARLRAITALVAARMAAVER